MLRPIARPFGPFYPPLLQPSVNHAERLSAVLEAAQSEARSLSASTVDENAPAHVWLTGRTSEVETFVAAIVDDWRRGVVSEGEASLALDHYRAGYTAVCGRILRAESLPRAALPTTTRRRRRRSNRKRLGERRHS